MGLVGYSPESWKELDTTEATYHAYTYASEKEGSLRGIVQNIFAILHIDIFIVFPERNDFLMCILLFHLFHVIFLKWGLG